MNVLDDIQNLVHNIMLAHGPINGDIESIYLIFIRWLEYFEHSCQRAVLSNAITMPSSQSCNL